MSMQLIQKKKKKNSESGVNPIPQQDPSKFQPSTTHTVEWSYTIINTNLHFRDRLVGPTNINYRVSWKCLWNLNRTNPVLNPHSLTVRFRESHVISLNKERKTAIYISSITLSNYRASLDPTISIAQTKKKNTADLLFREREKREEKKKKRHYCRQNAREEEVISSWKEKKRKSKGGKREETLGK